MADQLINELEKAAQVILAPPNLVSPELRSTAEEVFLNFRKIKSPYELCRQILETNTNDYILFEAAGLIKIAIIREWPSLSESDISSLREYLLHYVINKPSLTPYVKGCIMQVIAIIIKKGSINDSGQARQRILGEIENLIMTGDLPKKLLGCNLITAIMQEYVTNFKSSNIGLTWETHFSEKKAFQTANLKRIFKFCIGIIDELNKKELQEDSITLLKQLLPIVENVLTWTFVNSQFLIEMLEPYSESKHCIVLRLNADWQDVMLVPAVLDLMFTLYWKIRGNPQLAHHARTCLVQMASLSGSIMSSDQIKVQYLTNYVERFLKFITSINIIDEEASGIANIIKKLCEVFRPNLYALPKDMLKSFLDQLCRLTCMFIENSAQEESLSLGECLYTEALDSLFDTWIRILFEKNLFPCEMSKQSSEQIFNVYLRCHLSPPEGIRNISDADLEKEEAEYEEVDRVKFKEHLQIMGVFGRQVPNYSLPLLAQLIEDRTSKLRENFNKLVGQPRPLSTTKDNSMSILYEDLHWLILMIGNILSMDCRSEVSLIPREIMMYDMEQVQQDKIDLNLTLQFLASSENVSSNNVATESVDCVIRLVADIFRLCAIEKTAISVQLDNILSPELSCSIIWFLHTWSSCYLLPIEDCYFQISIVFLQAFGDDTSGALWVTNFLLEKIECNINAFRSEPALMAETIKLLILLVKSPQKAHYVLKSERFGSIINLATKEHYDFPKIVKRGLMQAVVQVALICPSKIDKCYWTQVLKPVVDRCKRITSDAKFVNSYHQENIKIQIIDILECMIGIALGAQESERGSLFQYVQPVLSELPSLLSLYHNYQEIVELILELLSESTKGPESILGHLTRAEAPQMYEICLNSIQTYTQSNVNRRTVDATAEEDSYQDILLLMKLLTNLVCENVLPDEGTLPADVFFCGFNIIMPMITTDLLQFPSLCLHYFQMIMFFCERYPQKVLNLSPKLLQSLLASVELGLFTFGHEVSTVCCNIIEILMKRIYDDVVNRSPANQIMTPFLNLLITVILTHHVDPDFLVDICIPLHYLIYCYQDEYTRIVQNILSTQTDQQVVQRLADAFTDLNVKHKRSFKSHYDKFISNLQGFLMVK